MSAYCTWWKCLGENVCRRNFLPKNTLRGRAPGLPVSVGLSSWWGSCWLPCCPGAGGRGEAARVPGHLLLLLLAAPARALRQGARQNSNPAHNSNGLGKVLSKLFFQLHEFNSEVMFWATLQHAWNNCESIKLIKTLRKLTWLSWGQYMLIKLGVLCMYIVSAHLVKISIGENICQRKKISRKFLSGNLE